MTFVIDQPPEYLCGSARQEFGAEPLFYHGRKPLSLEQCHGTVPKVAQG